MFENSVMRIFGPEMEEVAGGWRGLCKEELHHLYISPKIIKVIKLRRVRWAVHVARIGEMRNSYNVLVGKPGGEGPLVRPRRRWED
jgi:hypothetical protein